MGALPRNFAYTICEREKEKEKEKENEIEIERDSLWVLTQCVRDNVSEASVLLHSWGFTHKKRRAADSGTPQKIQLPP